MKNKNNYKIAMLFVLMVSSLISAQTISGVFSTVGNKSTNSTQHLSFTIGESLIGYSDNSSTKSYAGFWYTYNESLTTNVQDQNFVPSEFKLEQNYPNPFNPVTTINFSLPERSMVTLKVYNIVGEDVAILINEEREAGIHSVNFDANRLSSGVYFYKIQAGSYTSTKKMLLIK